jgi:hypothetical protein
VGRLAVIEVVDDKLNGAKYLHVDDLYSAWISPTDNMAVFAFDICGERVLTTVKYPDGGALADATKILQEV